MIVASVHKAEQTAGRIFSEVSKVKELTPRRAVLLRAIDANPGVTQTTLTEDTGIDRSTLATMLVTLQKKGWVKRVRDKQDARAYLVTLTAAGNKLLPSAVKALEETGKRLLTEIPSLKALA